MLEGDLGERRRVEFVFVQRVEADPHLDPELMPGGQGAAPLDRPGRLRRAHPRAALLPDGGGQAGGFAAEASRVEAHHAEADRGETLPPCTRPSVRWAARGSSRL